MKKIGIFGGSFNPVHNGHIYLAENIMEKLELDKIIMMPANISPHKLDYEYADGNDRLEMCRLACEGKKNFEVSDWEISRNEISYTYNTVMHFREEYPDCELYLMVGSDMFLCFERWYRYRDILENAVLTVVSREKDDRQDIERKKSEFELYGKIIFPDIAPLVISSTEIRKSIKNHGVFSCYLSEKVVQYIKQKKLYL
jgi:nicotinate-nucleotide adenylyltransferase